MTIDFEARLNADPTLIFHDVNAAPVLTGWYTSALSPCVYADQRSLVLDHFSLDRVFTLDFEMFYRIA